MNRRTLLSGFAAAFAAGCSPHAPTLDTKETIRKVFLVSGDPVLGIDHGKLISAFRVIFVPIEEGAPGINHEFPFGDKVPVLERALSLLGTNDRLLATRLLAESGRILPAYISRAQLAPGKYKVPADMAAYFSTPESGVAGDGSFMFRKAHAALLRGANWRLVDAENIEEVLATPDAWPMPYIDGKRPYGDMSFYQLDMARLLGEPYAIGPDQSMVRDEAKDARLEKLHWEMTAALQIFLANARLPG